MARYRLLEIKDTLINKGDPFWRIEKHILGLWWTEYFEEHSEWGATFYNRDEVDKWYNYHTDPSTRIQVKVIAQNQ